MKKALLILFLFTTPLLAQDSITMEDVRIVIREQAAEIADLKLSNAVLGRRVRELEAENKSLKEK